MGFESVVRRFVFGRKAGGADAVPNPAPATGSPELHPAMIAELQRLDLYRAGLARATIHHVASGERSDLIDAIAALCKATPRYSTPYFADHKALGDAEGNTNVAVVKGSIRPGAEVSRLLGVRMATGSIRHLSGPLLTPQQLVLSGFSAMISDGLRRSMVDYRLSWDTIISLKTLFAHMRQVGGTMTDLFALVLRRDETKYPTPENWAGSGDFAEYVTTYPTAFAEALRNVDPKTRLDAVKLAERHGATATPEIEAALVTLLTKPFDKNDREIAASALARLDPVQLLALLQRELPVADIDTRFGLVLAAGRSGTAEILDLLAAREKVEKAAKVKAAIQAVLEAGTVEGAATGENGEPAVAGYTAIDGTFIALPEPIDLGSDEIAPPSANCRAAFDKLVETIEASRLEFHAKSLERHGNRPNPPAPPKAYAPEVVEASFAAFTQATPLPVGIHGGLVESVRSRDDGRVWLRTVLATLSTRGGLKILRATGAQDFPALVGDGFSYDRKRRAGIPILEEWLEQGRLDVRDISGPASLRTLLSKPKNAWYEDEVLLPLKSLPRHAVWPWLADNMSALDEALGLQPAEKPIPLGRALEVLELLPKASQRYFAKLLDIAVSEKRPLRRRAMALLRDARDLVSRIEALLDDKRQQVRTNAAVWLADIRSTASEGVLRKRLGKEKSDPVRAALIESLQRLGADLTDVIGPATLIAEARAACDKTAAVLPEWLTKNGLPAPHFRDGSTVPPLVAQHWLALAIRLKDPGASGQFGIYLDQLLPEDARNFSAWVLESWIGYDTYALSLEEATAYAQVNYQNHFIWLCHSHKSPQLREQAIVQMIRDKTADLLNSGSDTKGMLALACRADPVFAAGRVRWFLKKHGRRSNQAMALLEVLAGIGQPAALQVVIAASTRLKQKSTQARATEIAERYAEDRGWSLDELADRTVPSAGFDDDGELELPCGEDEKLYVARLDAMLAIHLFNAEGKPVKSLPAGDDEATKESKKAFAAAKKELAQVIDLQGGRLFEAMCVERAWPVADWRLAFHEHPVMRRLVERLVWQGLNADGNPQGLFRPTQEGDFTDAGDNTVDIEGFAKVRLAHGALADEATCKAWLAHLKDYEVTPFLAQFDHLRAPLSAAQGEADMLNDRQGWKADSLTFRGVAEKRGYERIMRDGGGCNEYEKKFPSHGITATIYHTGSYAVEENNPVALKELRFTKKGERGAYRLKDVPPVMLAECWADYHAVAAKGAFDPDWEKVSPW